MQWIRGEGSTRAIASIAVIGALTACSETTSPEITQTPATPIEGPAPAAMIEVAGALDDMTEWWMPSVADETERNNLQQTLTSLKSHLNAGKILLCQQDVTDARGALSRLSEAQQVETAPVGVALDNVQSLLDNLAK
jgi:hypothetical protein